MRGYYVHISGEQLKEDWPVKTIVTMDIKACVLKFNHIIVYFAFVWGSLL
jgi:hypothetical protein